MKVLPLFGFLVCSLLSNGQIIKVDKITGDTTWHSGFEKLYSKASLSGNVGEQLKINASKDKNGYKLGLFVQTAKSIAYSMPEKSLMRIKLNDGSIVDLSSGGTGARDIADDISGGTGITVFILTDDQVKQLSNKQIIFIRLEGRPGSLEYDIKEKFQKVISECLSKIR